MGLRTSEAQWAARSCALHSRDAVWMVIHTFAFRSGSITRDGTQVGSDLNNHVLQASRIGVHDLAFIFTDNHGIGVAEAAPIGIVDAGFATERHSFFENGLIALCDPGRFVPLEADSVSGAMFEKFFESGFANLIEAALVDILGDGSLF